MFGTVFEKATGYLDRRLVVTTLFPLLAFASAVLAVVLDRVGWDDTLAFWHDLGPERRAALVIAAVAGLLLAASLLSAGMGAVIRLFEGYWSERRLWTVFHALGVAAQRRQHKRLSGDKRAYERRYREMPRRAEDLLPTRFGNALRAAEQYPGDDQRWGLDAVFFWPRLYALLPAPLRDDLQQARSSMDLMVTTSSLALVFAVGAVVSAVVGTEPLGRTAAVPGAALVVHRLAYAGAVRAAVAYGELVRSAFDLYRLPLLDQLGFARPTSLEEERGRWLAIQQQLFRRGADDDAALAYASDGG